MFDDRAIGALVAGTSLDANYAQELSNLSRAGVVIAVGGSIVARTVSDAVARDLVASDEEGGTRTLGGEEYAVRLLPEQEHRVGVMDVRRVRVPRDQRVECLARARRIARRHQVARPAGHQDPLAAVGPDGSIAMRSVAMPIASITRGLSSPSSRTR
jgi:hypothetical protein